MSGLNCCLRNCIWNEEWSRWWCDNSWRYANAKQSTNRQLCKAESKDFSIQSSLSSRYIQTLSFLQREAFSNIGAWGGITAENFDRVEDLKCMVEVGGVFGFHSDFGFNDNIVKDASSLHPVNPKQLAAAISILKSLGVSYSIQPRFYETAEVTVL